jgi:hypothetical protein
MEAQRLADSVDVIAAAAVVVRGFGLGHHVAAFARRLTTNGTVVVFEPDVDLLRSVLERVDCTAWLAASGGRRGRRRAGTKIIDHPPSRARLRDSADVFGATLASVVSAVRTNVATTLVQVEVTLRNVLNNVGVYTGGAGITDLARSAAARVLVAGPSKNVDLLAPRRVPAVIIACRRSSRNCRDGRRPTTSPWTTTKSPASMRAHEAGCGGRDARHRARTAIPRSFPGSLR